jgi:hypothetical protein
MPRKPRVPKVKPVAEKAAAETVTGRKLTGRERSRANLVAGGKAGRKIPALTREAKAFSDYCRELSDLEPVRETMKGVLLDGESRNYVGTLTTVLAYGHGKPRQSLDVQHVHRYVLDGPNRPATAEEWAAAWTPPELRGQAPAQVSDGPLPEGAQLAELLDVDPAE